MNKLYFQSSTCDLLDNLRKEYWNANWDYFALKRLEFNAMEELDIDEKKEARKQVYNATIKIQKDIPEIMAILEDDFRKLIGVL